MQDVVEEVNLEQSIQTISSYKESEYSHRINPTNEVNIENNDPNKWNLKDMW